MTVETVHAHVPAVRATAVPDSVATLRAWASTYAEVANFIAPIVATPFCPDAFRPRVDSRATAEEREAANAVAVATATAAVLYGAGIGFDPLTSLQNIYVISGRPALYADAMVAVVQGAGHEVWTEDLTDARAVVCGRRAGQTAVERVTVTMDMAKKAGWTRNAKYQSEPQSMLWARAASRVCKRVALDALKGIGSSVEDLLDGDDTAPATGTRTVTRAPAKPRAAIRRTATPAPADRPPLPGELHETPPVPGSAEPAGPVLPSETEQPSAGPHRPVTADQLKKLHACFSDRGITDRSAGLLFIAAQIGRTVTSSKDLTVAEASRVIDALDGPHAFAPVGEPSTEVDHEDDGEADGGRRPGDAL